MWWSLLFHLPALTCGISDLEICVVQGEPRAEPSAGIRPRWNLNSAPPWGSSGWEHVAVDLGSPQSCVQKGRGAAWARWLCSWCSVPSPCPCPLILGRGGERHTWAVQTQLLFWGRWGSTSFLTGENLSSWSPILRWVPHWFSVPGNLLPVLLTPLNH